MRIPNTAHLRWGKGVLLLLSWAILSERAAGIGQYDFSEAKARIEQYRKADAVVSVVDPTGKPASGVRVSIRQTRHAFLFGANIAQYHERKCGSPEYERAFLRHFSELFNYATLPFYWDGYEPQEGQPEHAREEEVARWCRDHGITTKGHPLAWNNWDPGWLPDDPDRVLAMQLARIDDCVSRFRGLIDTWDVVNEPTLFDREECKRHGAKMTTMWKKAGPVHFPRSCFLRARKANPEATLLVNDFISDQRYTRLIGQLVDGQGGRLYDAIGLQGHFLEGTLPSNEQMWEITERFARFGVPLHATEVSILSGTRREARPNGHVSWPSTPLGERPLAGNAPPFGSMRLARMTAG